MEMKLKLYIELLILSVAFLTCIRVKDNKFFMLILFIDIFMFSLISFPDSFSSLLGRQDVMRARTSGNEIMFNKKGFFVILVTSFFDHSLSSGF